MKLDQFKNQTFAKNLVVNWESMKRTEKDGIEIYEIEVKEKNPTIIKSNLFQSKLKYELISIKKENQSYSYLIEIYSGLKYSLYVNSIQEIGSFTGTLNVYELSGKQIDQLVVNNGKSINPSGNKALIPLNEVVGLFYLENKKTSRVPECYLSEHIYVTYSIYTDHYYYISVGNSTEKTYSYTTITTYTVDEPMSVPCGESESSYETYKYVTIRQEIVENVSVSIENNIDDTQLDPCLKEIMEQLKNATNADIANVMTKLGAKNDYIVTMKMGTMQKPGNYAETIKVSKNNYLVTVTQNDFTTASKLYKATALLHETIHAFMLSVVDDYNTYPTNAPFTDFPELFNIYVNKTNSTTNSNYAQHEDMANKYVNAIASALEQYQLNDTGIPSSVSDKQVFLDMAWSGLQGTDVYNKKCQEGIIDNTRITARIGAEINGVYSQGQYAVGKQCN
ncbi:hypothetical protein [Flavobacterium sp.]|uniref:hypothetical protein n=1 Tax=Flavobacterium sp. TaxID=239 RepID=UPI0025BD3725|nr:hypothetical protein [Flavobacterium sp.]